MNDDSRTSVGYEEVLQFLKQPHSYPHGPGSLHHIQTHISHVYIVPPFVYKVKKPVNLNFLDYSSLEERRKNCFQEVQLNRRLCREIYLGVEVIYSTANGLTIGTVSEAPEGSIVEYAVKMKKLPEDYFLYKFIEDNTLTSQHLIRVADTLADFYSKQEPAETINEWGSIENIRFNTDENFQQVQPFVGDLVDESAFNAIKKFTDSYLSSHQDLFEQRIADHRIVDGHGDLHLDHIHVSPDRVCIYDCIEFNDRFRYGDLASDLAYLAMDLDFNNQPKGERFLIEQMKKKLEDFRLDDVLNFYKCYRAFVKAKVKALQSKEDEIDKEERHQLAEKATQYFKLSLKYALLGSKSKVLIFIGGVGTGKSTLAQQLHQILNIDWYSSDWIRKKMAGIPLTKRTPESKRRFLYTEAMSDKTYRKLREKAREQLMNKKSAILDATFSNKEKRATFIHLLEARDVDYYFVETQAPDQIVRERLKERDRQDEVISDARIEDFEILREQYEPPHEINPARLIRVNTHQSIEASLGQLYTELVSRNIKDS